MQPPLCRILDDPLQPPPEFGRVWRAWLELMGIFRAWTFGIFNSS